MSDWIPGSGPSLKQYSRFEAVSALKDGKIRIFRLHGLHLLLLQSLFVSFGVSSHCCRGISPGEGTWQDLSCCPCKAQLFAPVCGWAVQRCGRCCPVLPALSCFVSVAVSNTRFIAAVIERHAHSPERRRRYWGRSGTESDHGECGASPLGMGLVFLQK